MSRSGYSDDCGGWDLICWRGAVNSAIKGKRGQAFLIELRDALDAMPEKRLIAKDLVADGEFCALGAIGTVRGLDMSRLDPDCRETVAAAFNIAPALAAEIVYENDECGPWLPYPQTESSEARWIRMRNWVDKHIAREAT